jgi:2,3-bisphosphoglycerate-dependent phosphoglycerate mutase
MELYIIRHGQSHNNRLWIENRSSEGRSPDPPLTDKGRKQAELLSEFLLGPAIYRGDGDSTPTQIDNGWAPQNIDGFGLTHLYCSLMLRAVQTGSVVAQALKLPLVAWLDAHEVGGIHRRNPDTGEHQGLPGKNRAFFETHFPQLVLPDDLGDGGWWSRPFELPEQRSARAARFVRELEARHGGTEHRVAIISHGGFYGHLMCEVFGIPPGPHIWFSLENTGITRIGFEDDYVWLSYANRVDFLPRELVT